MTNLDEVLADRAAGVEVPTFDAGAIAAVGERRVRRFRRLASGAAVVAVVVLVAGIIVGGSLLRAAPDRDRPEPSFTPIPPPGQVVELGSSGDRLFVITRHPACKCHRLWVQEGETWRQVQEFQGDQPTLTFAPGGRDGWLAIEPGEGWGLEAGQLWATHDGGETWTVVSEAERGWASSVLVTDSDVWLLDNQDVPLRAAHDSDDFTATPVDGFADLYGLAAGDAGLVAFGATSDGSSGLKVTADGGATWTDLPEPCTGWELIGSSTFALCRTSQVVLEPGSGDWQQFGQFDGSAGSAAVIDEERILLHGAEDQLLTRDGAQVVDLDVKLGEQPMLDAATVNGTTYLATGEGLLVSEDGGLTWRLLAEPEPSQSTPPPTSPSVQTATPGGQVSSLPPAGSVPTDIPDDYPLADGMPPEEWRGGEHPELSGPNRTLKPWRLSACGNEIDLVAGTADRLAVRFSDIEYGLTRQLATYPNANAAIAAVQAMVNLYRDCPTEEYPDAGYPVERIVRKTDVGGESWELRSEAGVSLNQTHVIRVGLAVLIIQESSEGGQQFDPHYEEDLDVMTTDAAAAISAMCRFTEDGC